MLDRRTLLTAGAAGAAVPLLGPAVSAEARPVAGRVLARDLRVPWGLAFLPNGDALVGERPSGRVHRVDLNGGRRLVGTIAGVNDFGEGGLLGIAVAPTFADDRWVYFYLTTDTDNRIIRMRYADGRLSDRRNVLTGLPFNNFHNGGRLAFSPGGKLFVGTGDVGNAELAQNTSSLAGKILRLQPNGDPVPGNPFGNRVWSYGHRNVQGLAWSKDGRMWASELGQSTRDELNRIRAGRNYGWPRVEGGDGAGGYADPFVTWRPTDICSPSGIAVTRGHAWVGALRGECLWSVKLDGPRAKRKIRWFSEDFGRIRTVEKAPDGSLWITTSNRDGRGNPIAADDRVIRVVFR